MAYPPCHAPHDDCFTALTNRPPFGALGLLRALLAALAALVGCSGAERSLSRPNAVALAGDQIYVSDFHHQRIVTFSTDGQQVSTFGRRGLGRNQLWEVWGLLSDPDSGDLFVLNERPTSSTDDARIREVKTFRGGREVDVVALRMEDGSAPEWSEGISRDPAGRWSVAALESNAIQQFGPDGAFLRAVTTPEDGTPLEHPSALHQENSALWVVEQFEHRIRRLNTNGRQTLVFGAEGSGVGELRFPKALDLCPGGWLVVADLGIHRVQRFNLAGEHRDGFTPAPVDSKSPVQLVDIAVGAGCEALYLVDSKGDRVVVTTPTGEVTQTLSSW